jgi:hypothetical protein
MTELTNDAPQLDRAETLMGDLRDAILSQLKALKHPWQLLKEDDQRSVIFATESMARNLVCQAIELVATRGHPALPARLVKAQLKDGMQCQIDFSRHDPQRNELLDHIGKPVMVVLADSSTFMGQTQEAKPEPDQSSLLDER